MGDAPYGIRLVFWAQAEPLLSMVRRQVFILEQGVPEELEWDGEDATAVHALAIDAQENPIGTGRLLIHGTLGHIGRMAVIQTWRGQRVGSAILQALLDAARERGVSNLFLNAQTYAVPFYARFGFVREGEEFLDAGIPHYRMTRQTRRTSSE